jgi:hypothetical protein
MITCPPTQKPVYTGVTLDQLSFERPSIRNMLQGIIRQCPHCGSDHPWQGKDAFPEEE